jgi:hypothetical protein
VRCDHQEIAGQRDRRRRKIEDQKETEQPGRPQSFQFPPQIAREGVSEPAAQQAVQRSHDARAQRRPSQPTYEGRTRRLIEPYIAIQDFPGVHLLPGGERQRLLRPQDVEMTHPRCQQQHEQTEKHQGHG